MKNNEEKMIIVEIKPNDGTACPLLDISNEMAPVCTLDNRVPYCKECRKVFSRSEAVEKMARAMRQYEFPKSKYNSGWEGLDKDCQKEYLELAEAALDALLGKGSRKW